MNRKSVRMEDESEVQTLPEIRIQFCGLVKKIIQESEAGLRVDDHNEKLRFLITRIIYERIIEDESNHDLPTRYFAIYSHWESTNNGVTIQSKTLLGAVLSYVENILKGEWIMPVNSGPVIDIIDKLDSSIPDDYESLTTKFIEAVIEEITYVNREETYIFEINPTTVYFPLQSMIKSAGK